MMLRDLWDHQVAQAASQVKALRVRLLEVEKNIEQFLERILDARLPSVMTAIEERIRKLEEDKLSIKDQMASVALPASTFEDVTRTALEFLSNPLKLWNSERLEDRRTVVKLAFLDRLEYVRGEGYRTADLSLPFKVLRDLEEGKKEMARPRGVEPLSAP